MKDLPPLIINAALTGMVPRKADNPNTPVHPEEIAENVLSVREAGASIVHLHARDADEEPTYKAEIYADIIERVRDAGCDIVVCVSCSGRKFGAFDQRAQVLGLEGRLKPEMASLTLGSLNFPRQASINEPDMIKSLAAEMEKQNILPELEAFDLGMIDYARYLIERGHLRAPCYCNLLLGSLGTLSATPQNLTAMIAALPEGTVWAATGVGRFQFQVNAMAVAMGGHVRVGLEDWLYMDSTKSRLASNTGLVRRIADLAHACEREIATPDQTRELLGLAKLPAEEPRAKTHSRV